METIVVADMVLATAITRNLQKSRETCLAFRVGVVHLEEGMHCTA
jgi:hypothetical protein